MTGYCIPYFCYSFSHFYVEQLRNDKLSIDEDELQEVRGIMGNIALAWLGLTYTAIGYCLGWRITEARPINVRFARAYLT